MTHHDDVVIKDAANIEGAGGTTTESMAFVEGLRVLVGAVGAQSHGCVPALRRISDRLDGNPAGYLLGREQPKEFTPK